MYSKEVELDSCINKMIRITLVAGDVLCKGGASTTTGVIGADSSPGGFNSSVPGGGIARLKTMF